MSLNHVIDINVLIYYNTSGSPPRIKVRLWLKQFQDLNLKKHIFLQKNIPGPILRLSKIENSIGFTYLNNDYFYWLYVSIFKF